MPLPAGTAAPDFSLLAKTDEGLGRVSLDAHRGKDVVVLLFFPAAFTGACTQEMCDVTGGLHGMPGASVYGISGDLPHAQEAWAKASRIAVPLLSDHDLATAKAYDAIFPDFAGIPVASRASFVIDRNGTIAYSEQTASLGDLPDYERLQQAVEAAIGDDRR